MTDHHGAAGSTPMLFTEKKINTTLLGVAFAFSVAGGITLLVHAWQTERLWPVGPIGVALIAWGLLVGNNLAVRRRLSPVLRLEAQRFSYIGGAAWKPRMISIDFRDITQVDKVRSSGIILHVRQERRARIVPIGLLSKGDREAFIQGFHARCDASRTLDASPQGSR
ncbi:hypothetical protein [Kushneria marisflavi]|uniref:Uncharacterized protein n=1 Tax=Kushneria marisflavi TaxID=157779 RepID=A0A240UMH0_9GAMM|nr:hypothetical protein [Kushneria marisflavi]ART62219.1 hypothetical protein B9H00_03295 [Kushneria marisflavi]RKD87304.1 hypothetical protein C8D96_0772 [Kushneria marisflavi]